MNTLTSASDIQKFRLLCLRKAIQLEMKGMKNSRGSVTARVRREFGFKGNRAKVLTQLEKLIRG